MAFTKEQLQEMAGAVPFWFHSIDLGQGVVTNGWITPKALSNEVESLRLPDLTGQTVLDINAWDGFYSFEAARRGAGCRTRPLHVGDGPAGAHQVLAGV